MGKHVTLQHRTEYRYERPVSLGPQTIQLRPTPQSRTPILKYSLAIQPVDHTLRWQFDAAGNHVARVGFAGKVAEFAFTVDLEADLAPYNPFDFVLDPGFETFPFLYPPDLAATLSPYRFLEPSSFLLNDFIHGISVLPQPTVSFLVALNGSVHDRIGYVTRLEHGVQTPEQTLAKGTGSCRDSAWLMVQVCRRLGLAARFVSGYLIQLAAEGDDAAEPNAIKTDSADLHAWAEVYLPGAGWIGMDATSGLFTAEGHIPLACSPSPAGAAPLSGTVEPAGVDFHYTMTVRRADGDRLTEPYTADEWAQVCAVAHAVDEDLRQQDVRLTMGGEPTFVGIDDAESMQWNIAALGPEKRTIGLALIRSLRTRTAPGALLHLGQGKWYPGEPLPRWAFHCISRNDGVPVWENGQLFAEEGRKYGYGDAEALRFMQALTRRLEVGSANILPGYDPFVEDATCPAGYVLPLRRRQAAAGQIWSSQLWFERPERLVLSQGDSPIGYRIPVEAMPWVVPDTVVYEYEQDERGEILKDRVKLPSHPLRRADLFAIEPAADTLPAVPEATEPSALLIRPSLCVEVREERLHVFLPFIPVLSDYLDLIAAVEDTSAHLGLPIQLEGYTPTPDPRVRSFSLTPDPGVLEVNLPPTSDWDELEALNAVLAEEAEQHRLMPSKFAYDGSHLATGGGSHITLGGTSVLDSPVLRRPDLLRSMIGFWQNHPSLAYLFSGMYVGPTSQYPRVDEARTDALYEMELAFSHLPADNCPPWIVDGLFRNLLVDVTGNSHRAEFCIDKLYPPEGQGLRLGLLELRAFEMAPHYRMGLLQTLLVRALVAAFWKTPFAGHLERWDNALHDRFMLPHFVEQDFHEVLRYLEQAGFPLDSSWFAPQREFRFPSIGSVSVLGMQMELRQALEPWNVLAEEATAGGTGRSVDSSLERIQLKLTGITAEGRYTVFCNGRRVPLTPTGQPGEAVAGVRYRARRLNASLHPTIPVHTPLTFDLVDGRSGLSIARCTYYAGPPDGTIYTTRPKDAVEARGRRRQRFEVSDPPTHPLEIVSEEENHIYPMTLDLRWPVRSGVVETAGPPSIVLKA